MSRSSVDEMKTNDPVVDYLIPFSTYNSPSQVRPDSQNMTGTLSFFFVVPSFSSFPNPPPEEAADDETTTLPACRDGTNRPKVMDSPPALGLGCRMRW